MSEREIQPSTRYDWEQVIRRARFGSLVAGSGRVGANGRVTRGGMSELMFTAIALCWSSYADPDGTAIWAGDATVAVDLGTTIKNVATVRKKLLELGLIQHVRRRRLDHGEEYRLTQPSDLLDVLDVPTPAQHKLAARRLRDAARGKRGGSGGPVGPEPSGGPVDHPEAVDNPDPGGPVDPPGTDDAAEPGWSGGPAEIASGWSGGPALGGPVDPLTYQDRPLTTTGHPDTDLRTAVTASRASPPPEDQIPSGGGCPTHGSPFLAGDRADGKPRCQPCRAALPGGAIDQIAALQRAGRPSLRVITGGAA